MTGAPRIAIDAMGGDTGPAAMIAGASRALRRDATLQFTFYGDERQVESQIAGHKNLAAHSQIVHSPESIAASEKPSQAIRRARTTSMGMAINAVKEGIADAALSGGNTGALMAMSKLALRTMPGIDRPALAALLPTLGENDLVMLDLGANTECDVNNLVQFAVMGAAYARVVLELEQPRVQLLNIGTEEMKGTDELKDALVTLHPQSAMEHLHHRFVTADGSGSDGAIAVEATEVASTVKQRTLVPVRPSEPLAGVPERSPIPLADTVGDGVAAVSASAQRARSVAGGAAGRVVRRLQDRLPTRSTPRRRVKTVTSRVETQRRAAMAILALRLERRLGRRVLVAHDQQHAGRLLRLLDVDLGDGAAADRAGDDHPIGGVLGAHATGPRQVRAV